MTWKQFNLKAHVFIVSLCILDDELKDESTSNVLSGATLQEMENEIERNHDEVRASNAEVQALEAELQKLNELEESLSLQLKLKEVSANSFSISRVFPD